MHSVSLPWQGWALLSAVAAALTAIFGKIGVQGINSDFATLIRTVIILLVLAAFVGATGQIAPLETVTRKTWLFLGLSALATGASWVCYYRALQIGEAARVAPVEKLSVVIAAVLAVIFLGERLDLRGWLGVAFVGGGVVLLALPRTV